MGFHIRFDRVGLVAMVLAALALAACGGGGGGSSSSGLPTLAGTEIPTVAAVVPTQPNCDFGADLGLPASFPTEIPVPPAYRVSKVSTTPYLHVEGHVVPVNNGHSEPPKGMVSSALHLTLQQAGWSLMQNLFSEAQDYNFTSADGAKKGRYVASDVIGCEPNVLLTYDIMWVTP